MSKDTGQLQDKNGNSLFPIGVEVITNSNGTAIKYADGTMICYGSNLFTFEEVSIDWWSFMNRTNSLTTNFPMVFIGNPIVQFGWSGIFFGGAISNVTNSLFAVQLYSPKTASSTNATIFWIAIGY